MSLSPVNLLSQPKDLGLSNPNEAQLDNGGGHEQFSKTLKDAQQARPDSKNNDLKQSDRVSDGDYEPVEQSGGGRSAEEASGQRDASSRDPSKETSLDESPAESESERQDDSPGDQVLPDPGPSARDSKAAGMNWLTGISDRFFQTELPSGPAKTSDVMALANSGNSAEGTALGLREALARLRLQPEGEVRRANATMAGFNGDRFLSSGASGRNALAEQMLAANLESSAALLKGGGQSDAGSWGRQGAESAFQIASLTESGRLTGTEVKSAFATLLNNASQQADVVRQMGQHAKMMLAGKMQFAELKLTPANLGTVEILMKQENDQTSLVFFSKNPAVREAIENNMLRLQKNFEADGLMLGQASVSDQSLAEHKEQMAAESDTQRSSIDVGTQEEQVAAEQPLAVEQDGMLNLWV
jgi:flagellar hook-length control protein FliK